MEEIIFTADGEQKKIQAVNAMSGMIGKYTKLVEVVDLEARLSTLEEQMKNDSFKKIKTLEAALKQKRQNCLYGYES